MRDLEASCATPGDLDWLGTDQLTVVVDDHLLAPLLECQAHAERRVRVLKADRSYIRADYEGGWIRKL